MIPLGVSMDRAGSGTTWIPDAVRVPSKSTMAGAWHLMAHGFVFGQYDAQGGERGASQLGSLNWGMFMASRSIGGGRFQARTMLSLDPATVTARGYPLLLQSGETYKDEPLHDRQHPHDFWMELGATYERPLTRSLGIALYAAPSGEPALSPVAFMHRPSAMDNPSAPLGHHWQDATHVSFGVLTAGVFTNAWKLEGSVFNGREPDEHRWDFDRITLDSYSARLTVNPTASWSFAAGYGFLKSPEAHHPDESLHRWTVSALHGRALGDHGQWSTAFVYGANKEASHDHATQSGLIESEVVFDEANTLFARAELVRKSAADLVLDVPPTSFSAEREFSIGAFTLGGVRDVARFWGMTFGAGVSGTINAVPRALEPSYGSRTPLGGMVFLRLRPRLVRDAMAGMDHTHHTM